MRVLLMVFYVSFAIDDQLTVEVDGITSDEAPFTATLTTRLQP
ncbi:MAG: hypothetical protein JWM53_1874 [bacterium]|jgi:hypothetical protein|nr:hypothetical protein [bacterium]